MARKKAAPSQDEKPGKISANKLRQLLNKRSGHKTAFNLTDEDSPTRVTEWIPTGSLWLDWAICKGKKAGIGLKKVTELAGLPACVTPDTIIEVIIED